MGVKPIGVKMEELSYLVQVTCLHNASHRTSNEKAMGIIKRGFRIKRPNPKSPLQKQVAALLLARHGLKYGPVYSAVFGHNEDERCALNGWYGNTALCLRNTRGYILGCRGDSGRPGFHPKQLCLANDASMLVRDEEDGWSDLNYNYNEVIFWVADPQDIVVEKVIVNCHRLDYEPYMKLDRLCKDKGIPIVFLYDGLVQTMPWQ